MHRTLRATLVGGIASFGLVAGVVAGTGLVNASAASSGTLVFALPPQTQIPWYFPYTNASNASLYTSQLLDQMYMPLFYIGDNYKISWANSLADKVTYNSAGTVYHVYLNPKWRWSNGDPVTTADAQFGWNVLLATENPKAPAPWPNYSYGSGDLPTNAQSFTVNSAQEFTVTLKKAVNQEWFIYNGLNTMTVMPSMPSAGWNKYPTNITEEIKYLGRNATDPKFDSVVDGPFELQSATQGQDWVLVPNPDFAGHKSTLSKVIYQYEASDTSEFAGLRTGTIQVGYLPAGDWAARAQLTSDRLLEEYGYNYFYTLVNMNAGAQGGVNKIFDNLYVRQALYEAMDNGAIAKVIYHGQAMPQYGPIPPTPKTPFLDPSLTKAIYPYDAAAAKKLLEAHGWKEVDGVMTNGTEKMAFTLLYPSGDEAQTETAELLQSDWASIGVKVTLKPTQLVTEFGLVEKAGSWQMATGIGIIYGGSYPSGESLFYKNQGLDSFGWNNAEENALIEKTISPAPSAAANARNFFNYEYYTAKELPTLWMPDTATDAEVARTVVGVNLTTLNPVTGDPLVNYWSVK